MLQLAHPKVAMPKPRAFRPRVCLYWIVPFSVKANSKLMPSASTLGARIFVYASHQKRLDTRSMTRRSIIGEGKAGHKSKLELCWTSALLVQCGPDEPSWIWTKIWVQARMPYYSLNRTARSSAIQRGQRC